MCMVILLLVCFFEVICMWLYYGWSVPLKLHVYGYIAAGHVPFLLHVYCYIAAGLFL